MASTGRRSYNEEESDSEVKKWFDGLRKKAQDMDAGSYQAPEEPNPYRDVRPDANHWYDHVDEPEPVKKQNILSSLESMWSRAKKLVVKDPEADHAPLNDCDRADDEEIDASEKEAQRRWKEAHPGETIKHWRRLQQTGRIKDVPWNHPDYHPEYQQDLGLQADKQPPGHPGEVKGFGTSIS
jgi:hypothetical protein